MSQLSGWKTYAAAAFTALFALLGSTLGFLDVGQTAALLAVAAGTAGLRDAVRTEGSVMAAKLLTEVSSNSDFVQQVRREIEAGQRGKAPLHLFDPDQPPAPAG